MSNCHTHNRLSDELSEKVRAIVDDAEAPSLPKIQRVTCQTGERSKRAALATGLRPSASAAANSALRGSSLGTWA